MIEDPLSEKILWKEFHAGETIVVDALDDEVRKYVPELPDYGAPLMADDASRLLDHLGRLLVVGDGPVVGERGAAARAALEAPAPDPAVIESVATFMQRVTRIEWDRCPHCANGQFVVVQAIAASRHLPRGPP